jgi:hypothetical protein
MYNPVQIWYNMFNEPPNEREWAGAFTVWAYAAWSVPLGWLSRLILILILIQYIHITLISCIMYDPNLVVLFSIVHKIDNVTALNKMTKRLYLKLNHNVPHVLHNGKYCT